MIISGSDKLSTLADKEREREREGERKRERDDR